MVDHLEEDKADVSQFLKAWAWKREHRSDKARFHKPYLHTVSIGGLSERLTVTQKPFGAEGFASTVWDSSIVVAKYFERWQETVKGKRCLDISAGCGLPGIVLSKLGAIVYATDTSENVDFLRHNFTINRAVNFEILEHEWGNEIKIPALDFIIACDVMYIEDAVDAFIESLLHLANTNTQIIVAHGRNRQAEDKFICKASEHFSIQDIPSNDLDKVYRCSDVRTLSLKLLDSRTHH